MVKQINLIFRLKDLQVYCITTVTSGKPYGTEPVQKADPIITEEYWWADTAVPKGVGPFKTISAAVRDYEDRYSPHLLTSPTTAKVIEVDFKAKKRQLNGQNT